MNRSKIISARKEKIFGLSMVDEDTELIFIDEWSENTLNISNGKPLFQGGWMVKSVKDQDAQTFDNKAGIYLTCNELPDFEWNNQMSTAEYLCFIQLNSRNQNVKHLSELKVTQWSA